MLDVIGIGQPCIDLNVNVDVFPKPNEGESVNQRSWQGGGKVATGLVAAARMGARCSMLGTVGADLYGSFCAADLKRHGIDTTGLLMREKQTTAFSIVISDKESNGRCIIYDPGTVQPLQPKEVDEAVISNSRYLFVSYLDEAERHAVGLAKAHGVKVFIDADQHSPVMEEMIPQIDVFVASEFVYKAMFDNADYEKNCAKILQCGPQIVVFTFGEKGCVGMDESGYFECAAFKVDVKDTVGAGDVFHGAFITALVKGQSAREAAQLASAVSAIKCTRIGGRAGIPTMEQAKHFMVTGEMPDEELDVRVKFYERGLEHV